MVSIDGKKTKRINSVRRGVLGFGRGGFERFIKPAISRFPHGLRAVSRVAQVNTAWQYEPKARRPLRVKLPIGIPVWSLGFFYDRYRAEVIDVLQISPAPSSISEKCLFFFLPLGFEVVR